jgi:hypothetical protein
LGSMDSPPKWSLNCTASACCAKSEDDRVIVVAASACTGAERQSLAFAEEADREIAVAVTAVGGERHL